MVGQAYSSTLSLGLFKCFCLVFDKDWEFMIKEREFMQKFFGDKDREFMLKEREFMLKIGSL